MGIKISKKSNGLDEDIPKAKKAHASSNFESLKAEKKSKGIHVSARNAGVPKSSTQKNNLTKNGKGSVSNFSARQEGKNTSGPGSRNGFSASSGASSHGKVVSGNLSGAASFGGAIVSQRASGSEFKLSIAPNMKKISVAKLGDGLINEYDRIAEEFKNKNIDINKLDQNQYWRFENGNIQKWTFEEISKSQRFKMTKEFNSYVKAEGQKCKDEGKLWKFNEKNIVRVDGVITFSTEQLRLQGASEKFILRAQREWTEKTGEAITKVYGKTDPVILRIHLDETNPHIHYSVVPRLQENLEIYAKRRDGSKYVKVIQKGTIGSKHIIDSKFLSESLSEEMRKSFNKSETLKKIDWGKLDKDLLKSQRASEGLNGHIDDLSSFKSQKEKANTKQMREAQTMREEIENIKEEDLRQEIFKAKRWQSMLEQKNNEIKKEEQVKTLKEKEGK